MCLRVCACRCFGTKGAAGLSSQGNVQMRPQEQTDVLGLKTHFYRNLFQHNTIRSGMFAVNVAGNRAPRAIAR